MSSRVRRITKLLDAAGMAWAGSATKHCHPDDPMHDQARRRKTWHVHPDGSNPRAELVERFDTLDELEAWIKAGATGGGQ